MMLLCSLKLTFCNVTHQVPNPPGPIEVLTKTTSSIYFEWQEAPLMTGASFSYRCIIPSQRVVKIPSTLTRHNFTSLLSGTPYNISVFTVGPMGFESDKVQIHRVTTSKGFISVSDASCALFRKTFTLISLF